MVIFSIRLAVLAVRTAAPSTYKCGVLALAAGSPKVDWRDVLGAFALFENCGKRLGIHFQDELETVIPFTDEVKLRSTIDGFFSRTDDMRAVDVMGIVECGYGSGWTFRSKAWDEA